MKNIFKKLYYGEVNEWERYPKEQAENLKEENQAYEKMYASFSKEQAELFEKFYNECMLAVSEEKSALYGRGVMLGIWLGLELGEFEL